MSSSPFEDCSILLATKLLAKKWTIFVLSELLVHGELRYSELQQNLVGKFKENISSRVLVNCLNTLEENGLVIREVKTSSPPIHVKYSLTEKGKDFDLIFAILKGWGIKWGSVKQKVCQSFTCIHNAVPFIDYDEARKIVPLIYKKDLNKPLNFEKKH